MALIQTKNFDQILSDMMNSWDNSYDKRQGSMLHNLQAPTAQEIAILYIYLEEFSNIWFLDTSYDEYLTRLASMFGVDRLPATPAKREVFFMENVPIGTRFSVVDNDINFIAAENLGGGMYYMNAEQPGTAGNTVQGELINIDVLPEFSGAVLGRVVIAGEDEETDDALRQRTAATVRAPSLNGNVAQYEKWASEFEGIGSIKVDPIWDGPNTVKVAITDASGQEASAELVAQFQDYLDPAPHGNGLGVAPIGAIVTVEGIQAIAVILTADVKLEDETDIFQVEEDVRNEMTSYLNTEAFSDGEIKNFKVLTILDRVAGIKSISNVKINGSSNSLIVGNGVPAVLSEVTLNVLG